MKQKMREKCGLFIVFCCDFMLNSWFNNKILIFSFYFLFARLRLLLLFSRVRRRSRQWMMRWRRRMLMSRRKRGKKTKQDRRASMLHIFERLEIRKIRNCVHDTTESRSGQIVRISDDEIGWSVGLIASLMLLPLSNPIARKMKMCTQYETELGFSPGEMWKVKFALDQQHKLFVLHFFFSASCRGDETLNFPIKYF